MTQHIASAMVRIKAREALDLQRAYFQQLFENSPAGIVMLDDHDIVLNANIAFENIFQYSIDELRGRNVKDWIVPESHLEESRELTTATYRRQVVQKETVRKRKDGSLVNVSITAYPIIIEDNLVGVYGMYVDITGRKKLEEHLREAQKMESLGTLAGGIAHDFNNILAIILGHASMVEKKQREPGRLMQSVEAINKATQRGTGLVKQLLTFARKSEVLLESVQLNEIVNEIVKLMAETFPKTITVSAQLEKNLPSIIGDANQIHQVLLNLCVNARDAMPRGGTMHLTTELVDGTLVSANFPKASAMEYVRVSVSDTGLGMDNTTRSRIFEPFFTTKERGKGTGLGLAVVYGIIENHRGFIEVESKVGEGTAFHFYLPIQHRGFESVEREDTLQKEIPGGTETILLVEDEELLRDLLKGVLIEKGYKVLAAVDGVEAVDLYASSHKKISLVLSDVGLPKLGGQEVLLQLKAIDPEVKIILASGYFEPNIKSQMQEAGANAFVQKPYIISEILQKIRYVLDND
ncbi:MAG: PAS domain S-box protein [Ignavibacteria bacterium]|nr:PAS domain S-box protein [Ignavibacteria bacterium]